MTISFILTYSTVSSPVISVDQCKSVVQRDVHPVTAPRLLLETNFAYLASTPV
jgi:hypothetical protein